MKRRLLIWVTFAAGLYYVLAFLLPPSFGGSPDSEGVSGPTVVPGNPGAFDPSAQVLCYCGRGKDRPPRILSVRLSPQGAPGPPQTVIAPSFARRDDYHGAIGPQCVAPDRLYYIGIGWDDKTPRVCLARRADGGWQPEARAVLDKGRPGAWNASGVTWVSVLPPGEGSPAWRMWFVARQGEVGRVGFATSRDGLQWVQAAKPVIEATPGASIESVSVAPWLDGARAWYVVRSAADRAGQLQTVAVSPLVGAPEGEPEPVAWQSPELRFGNLAPRAIPLRDARVVVGDTPRRLRLYVTYADDRGVTHITSADNRAIGGDPQATVFIRQVVPLVSPGRTATVNPITEANPAVDDLITVIGAFAVGLGLISLAQVHGRRVLRQQKGWPESLAFFAAVIAMTAFTFLQRGRPGIGWGVRGYDLLFYGMFQPLGSSMFALLAAYLVSAAYRAFKARTRDAVLMAAAAVLIMLGQVPVGNLLTQSLPHPIQIPTMMAWVLAVTNNAVIRAVNFGIFVGALATALRVWLSLDRAIHQMEV